MTTSTATVLFCDIVGSTPHRAELGEIEADRFFLATEQRFRDLVGECGGRVLKGGGDGIMAVFTAGSEAVSAAVALQRGVRASTPEIQLRVGVAAGDVTWEGDDCYGMPVVVAARLESACEPGGILVSAIVRALAGTRLKVEYEPTGPLELKGVPEPVEAYSVSWQVPDDEAPRWGFPPTLPSPVGLPLVGRSVEFSELMRTWANAERGEHGAILLGGEAGAGKTRLATELAQRCHREGAIVLAGLCDSELSLPYQPWVMILDQLVAQLPPDSTDELRAPLAHLLVLVPHLGEVVGGLRQPDRLDPEAERLRVFSAAATVLAAAAAIAPVLIVLDDLHWAGNQTLDLLRYLVTTKPVGCCLVVATHRDTSDETGGQLAAVLADFRRLDTVTHLKVGGITSDAVYELLDRQHAGGDLRARAEAITERTHGNAFLVTELLRHAADDIDVVPDSVSDVVRARMQKLGDDALAVANLIAVAGRVELPVLADAIRPHDVDLRLALGELIRSGLVQELSGTIPAYQFAHALIRDAVRLDVPSFDQAALHHVLALSIERVHTADRRSVLPALARHFAAATPVAGWEKAAYYGRRAAAHAHRSAAYEEAIELIESSLRVTPVATEERAHLLIDAVELLERCGRNPEAIELAEEADEAATEIGDPVLAARATIELERAAHLANSALDRSPPRLRRVLEAGDRLPSAFRVQAMASLARASWLNGLDGAHDLAAEALASARELGDEATVSHALEMACVIERDPRQALQLARELERTTAALGNIFQSMWAMTRQTDALLTLGRLAEAEIVLARLREEADRYRFTSYRYLSLVFTHTLALAAGAFDQAEAVTEAANTAEQAEFAGLDASGAFGLQMFMIRRAQGQLEEMRPVLRFLAQQDVTVGVWRPGLVLAYVELGMVQEARSGFDALMTHDWAAMPRDTLWPLALMFLADACIALERADAAAVLLDELEAHAGLTIRAGYTTNGGPADRCRAAMAELVGRRSLADQCIRDAHELARTSRSPLWLGLVESTWAWMLVRRGDRAEASVHHARALELADRFGLGCVPLELPDLTIEPAPAARTFPDDLSVREVEVLALLAAGCTNRQIAERLFISPNTAANHVRAILRKTGCANRTEAAAYAFGHRLADAPSPDG